jgi:hypothetical protein
MTGAYMRPKPYRQDFSASRLGSASDPTFERAKNIATIVSALAIPIVLTLASYFIQQQLASEGLQKDYVGIAAGILKENAANQEPELRAWAVHVLEEKSPVPFSKKVKESLITGGVVTGPAFVGAPAGCMKAPQERHIVKALLKLQDQIDLTKDSHEAFEKLSDFVQLVSKEEEEALRTIAKLNCAQNWLRVLEKSDAEWRKSIGAPSSREELERYSKQRANVASAAAGKAALAASLARSASAPNH